MRVDIDPGVAFGRHSHPGEEIIYVLDGTLEYQVDGQPPTTLKAGDVLFIPYGTIHAVKNVGTSNASELPIRRRVPLTTGRVSRGCLGGSPRNDKEAQRETIPGEWVPGVHTTHSRPFCTQEDTNVVTDPETPSRRDVAAMMSVSATGARRQTPTRRHEDHLSTESLTVAPGNKDDIGSNGN